MNENNANFTPDAPNFKTLVRMSFQGLTNFPYIEEDFDALTNYGLLSKVVEYLNEVISNNNEQNDLMTSLYNAYVSLQNYVNDYFDNLDVQDEINNKLDEMAANGTLTTLIRNYVDPYINAQNENIENFENSVNNTINDFDRRLTSVASGSPLVASSTSEMTDTTKTYVNTTDGNWYYYDGDSWEIGGVYQATAIPDGSVTYNNLETELKSSFISDNIPTNIERVTGTYIDQYGNIQSAAGYSIYQFNVNPFETYKFHISINSSLYVNGPMYVLRNGSSIISKVLISSMTIEDGIVNFTIDVPYNVDNILINTSGAKLSQNYILKVKQYNINDIKKEQLDTNLQQVFSEDYENVTPTLFLDNYIMYQNGTLASAVGYDIRSFDVNSGEKYKISGKQPYNNPIVLFISKNAIKVETVINDVTYTTYSSPEVIVNGEIDHIFNNYEFTIPDYCEKIYIVRTKGTDLVLKKATSYKIKIDDIDLQSIENDINPLTDKTIMFVGDSICAASTSGVKGWATLIQENNPSATVYNYGQDGATIAQNGNDNYDVYTKIQTMYEQHPNADYIIIQGGVNDKWQNIPLGTYQENDNFNGETPYDTFTFSGALEWIFHYSLTHFQGKKIGFIVTQKIYQAASFYQYMDRAKAICKKWSIPYVDLFEQGDMNYLITSQRQNYSITNVVATGDGCHPNLAGYEIITPKIEKWLKYKI